MKKRIWKYVLNDYVNTIEIPVDSEILNVGQQHDKAVVWVLIGNSRTMVTLKISGYLTGREYNFAGRYIGTVLLEKGEFVLHYYCEMV